MTDGGNFRVQAFTQDGQHVRSWGQPGRRLGQFSRPKGISIDPDGNGPAESFTISNKNFNRTSLRGTGVLRWEWRPGSTLFFVWQQGRSKLRREYGDFDLSRDVGNLFDGDSENVFMVKATYWLGS